MLYLKKIVSLPKEIMIGAINVYQKTLSPDHGPLKSRFPEGFCRYYPTCSEYGKQSIKKYGAISGGGRALWRIMRCNPWSKGGVDEVK